MLIAEVKAEFCRLITKIEVEYKPARECPPAAGSERSRGQSEIRPRLQNPPKRRGSAIFLSGTALGTALDNRQSFMPEGEQT
jgi:hypothetical protein